MLLIQPFIFVIKQREKISETIKMEERRNYMLEPREGCCLEIIEYLERIAGDYQDFSNTGIITAWLTEEELKRLSGLVEEGMEDFKSESRDEV